MNNIPYQCIICRSKSYRHTDQKLNSGHIAKIHWCSDCGFGRRVDIDSEAQLLDLQIDTGDMRSAEYDRHGKKQSVSRYSTECLLSKKIKKRVPRGSSILDVGCGMGQWLSFYTGYYKTFGIECSPSSADIAEKSKNHVIYRCQYSEFPSDMRFDVITAIAVIEHLFDPVAFVEWCVQRLSPGGTLVIMTGDASSGVARKMGNEWPLLRSNDHINYFSKKNLQELLKNSQLNKLEFIWRLSHFHKPWLSPLRYPVKLLDILGFNGFQYFDFMYVIGRVKND